MRKPLILVVDDELPIARLVRIKLEADGFEVVVANDGATALERFEAERPQLVILDLMMLGMDGYETLRRLRAVTSVPVILLTARASDYDKLRGLTGGADDYVTKPFNPDELSARVSAVLRRSAGSVPSAATNVLRYAAVEIDLDRRRVLVEGTEVRLTKTEWELLVQLGTNAGRVMLHGELLARIWGPEFREETHYLRTWISRLRAKLEPNADADTDALITTFPGIGYRLEAPSMQPVSVQHES